METRIKLIGKGILLYSTIILCFLIIVSIDSLSNTEIILYALSALGMVGICHNVISEEEIAQLLFKI